MKTIKASTGQVAKVSDGDYDFLSSFTWWASGSNPAQQPYFLTNFGSKRFYMHRILMGAATGTEVDHINGDASDNRRENLRIATRQQNCVNRTDYKPKSGFRGVYARTSCSPKRPWEAKITVNRKAIKLGNFAHPEDAARKYDEAAAHHFGDFAVLNFPNER